ncbi:MAG TPA: hypothetical protein VIL20_10710 [Sandaracinaceae bacterium]
MPLARRTHSPSEPTFGAIVEEVLGAVFAPARLHEVLHEALVLAEHPQVPEHPDSVRVFIEGPLFTVLARHLDVANALEIVGQIRSALELALTTMPDERMTSEVRERITLPAPPARALVVSSASLVVFLLGDMLGDGVDVVPVNSASDLADRLRRFGRSPLLVVVDRKHPCVDLSICTMLRRSLDVHSTVIWWTDDVDEQAQVSAELQGGPILVATEPDTRLADLGELCRRLTIG